jgi:hypothetical protein
MQRINGAEIAWHTLLMEPVEEPCLIASWCMKREFFQALSGRADIYADAPRTVADAFLRAGANLCSQFIMPSPFVEHNACDPFNLPIRQTPETIVHPEDTQDHRFKADLVRQRIEGLPEPDTIERAFNMEAEASSYARYLLRLSDIARGQMLFIGDFGQADFMGGYGWGYENYLSALALYPDHLERYYAYTGEMARLKNAAIALAIKRYGLPPFVYGGQDICFNDGPICSPETLDRLYWPHLVRAVKPLHEAGIRIVWHCDGDVRPILDTLIYRIGVAGFQGLQEETGCTLEHVAALRARDGRKLILWGSVSVTTTLPFGTEDDVRRDVERCFKVAAPGGGFVLASTSSILPETPLANIMALYEHGISFGRRFLRGEV